jgi:hypothetical protein
MPGMYLAAKDHLVASAFPLLIIPAPRAPEASQDQEVVHQQDLLFGRAGDLSNLRERFYLRWMENGRKEATLVHGNSMDRNLR